MIDVEQEIQINMKTFTCGMGCFWGHESRFGSLPGVLRTRVGYTGGTTKSPTYRKMGDHTESIEVDYNPDIIGLDELLEVFWRNHYPNRDEYKGRQYISLLFYHSDDERETIGRVKEGMEQKLGEKIETEIHPVTNFTKAEIRHQKYYLKRYPGLMEQLNHLYPEEELLDDSTFAARLNGFVKGFGTKDELLKEIRSWPMERSFNDILEQEFMLIKW